MGCPLMSRNASGSTGGAPSITLPEPLKELRVWDVLDDEVSTDIYLFECINLVCKARPLSFP